MDGVSFNPGAIVDCYGQVFETNPHVILLQAIWENQFYYLFGFLFLVYVILIISCSQISIVMVYFQLCGEVRTVCFSFLIPRRSVK